jgi:hypothetical protein
VSECGVDVGRRRILEGASTCITIEPGKGVYVIVSARVMKVVNLDA